MKKSEMFFPKADILFFERPFADVKKFALKIASQIKDKQQNVAFACVCIEVPKSSNDYCIDYFYHWNSVKKDIDTFLDKTNPKIIVFSNSRIPDLEFMLHAKKKGIRIIFLQEGITFDGTNINDVSFGNFFKSFFGFFSKTMSYILTLMRMCRYDKKSFIKLVFTLLKKKKNITSQLSSYFSYKLIGDFLFIIGLNWVSYYKETFGYSDNQIILVGDYNLDKFDSAQQSPNSLCYIANVLVEDGTISKKLFSRFVLSLARSIPNGVNIYLKLHPRSDKNLYKPLIDRGAYLCDEPAYLPNCSVYIGHRSTLIGKALYLSDNLILYVFPSEKTCFYEKYASFVCHNDEELLNALKTIDYKTSSNNKIDIIEKDYWKNPNGAMNTISENIYRYYIKEII